MKEHRTQAERRAESQARLVQAAIRLLGRRGYSGTSLVEIGREAGLSRGLVSHHFGTKEACMQAVVATIRDSTAERIDRVETHGMDAIDRLLEIYFRGVRNQDIHARAIYVVLIEGLTATPSLRPAVAETNAKSRATLTRMVEEAAAEEGVEPGAIDHDAVATIIEGILRGVALQWLADPDAVDLDRVVNTAEAMLRAHLRAAVPSRKAG